MDQGGSNEGASVSSEQAGPAGVGEERKGQGPQGPVRKGVRLLLDTAQYGLDLAKAVPLWGSVLTYAERVVVTRGGAFIRSFEDLGDSVITVVDEQLMSVYKAVSTSVPPNVSNSSQMVLQKLVPECIQSAAIKSLGVVDEFANEWQTKGLAATASDLYLKYRFTVEDGLNYVLQILEMFPMLWIVTVFVRWVLTALFELCDWLAQKGRSKGVQTDLPLREKVEEDEEPQPQSEKPEGEVESSQVDEAQEVPAPAVEDAEVDMARDNLLEEMIIEPQTATQEEKTVNGEPVDQIEELFDMWGVGGLAAKPRRQ